MKNAPITPTRPLETVARSPSTCQNHSLKNRFGHKVMLCVWFNFEGVIHCEFVPDGRAVDADLYSQQLERDHEILRQRNTVAGQCETHTARITMTNIRELRGIELLPHPAQSHDLAPSDYHLFLSMAHFLRGRNFENIEAVDLDLTEFFASQTRHRYRRGIINLDGIRLKAIERDGTQFEISLISYQKTFQIIF